MPELGTFGSVRGVPGNGYPYRNPRSASDSRRSDFIAGKLNPKLSDRVADVRGRQWTTQSRPSLTRSGCLKAVGHLSEKLGIPRPNLL